MWNHPPACRLQCWDALGQPTNRAGTQPTCHQTGYLKSSWAHSLSLNTPLDVAMPTRGKRPCSSHQWAGSSPSHHAAAAKSLQSCLTLCDPRDGSPPGSPVPGILHARTLEWAAISFSNTWKWTLKVKSLSRVWRSAIPWTVAYQAPPSMWFSRQEYWNRLPSFSRGSSRPRDRTRVSHIPGTCFNLWATREAPDYSLLLLLSHFSCVQLCATP